MGKSINWSSYNRSLINRGKITFWFSPDIVDSWQAPPTGKAGAQPKYSDSAIEVLSVLRFRYGLKLRCTQGFAESLIDLMNLNIEIPNYTTLSRRLKTLSPQIERTIEASKDLHVVLDATGLKVYGEGEWKVRKHGYTKRRTWMKLHLGVDEKNSQIVAAVLTDNSFKDNEVFDDLLDQVGEDIEQISADGAYDSEACYQKSLDEGINLVTPPRRGARLKQHANSYAPPHPRDIHLREIRQIGRAEWKKKNNYHRRSISETAMYRFKVVFGDKLLSRCFSRQANEAFIKLNILNKMNVPRGLAN